MTESPRLPPPPAPPDAPLARPSAKVQVRPLLLALWALLTLALLAEHCFSVLDSQRVRSSRRALALQLDDKVQELKRRLEENGNPETPADAELLREEQKEEQSRTIESLRLELEKLRAAPPPAAGEASGLAPSATGAGFGPAGEARDAPALEPVVGRVVAREEGSDLVAIDLGSRDGIRPGMRLELRSGAACVGRLVVLEVGESLAVGRVVGGPEVRNAPSLEVRR